MIFDATTSGTQANSYVDVATASDILTAQRLYATAWTALTLSDKEAVLVWATSLLDEYVEWRGFKASLQQALRWPRNGVWDRDHFYVNAQTIPLEIQKITSYLAYELSQKNRLAEPATAGLGVANVTIGPLSVETMTRSGTTPPPLAFIPPYIQAMLTQWGALNGMAAGAGARDIQLARA